MTAVKIFRSTDANAPGLSGQAGALITVLNACLVTGYGQVTLTSLTQTGGLATATVSGGHGFQTGTYVTIAGAVQTDYNGTFVVTSTSSTTFTFAVLNNPVTPATGTVTAIRTHAGWTKPYTSSSTGAVYRQGSGSNGFYLNIDDTGTLAGSNSSVARARGFETMTSWSNGTNPYPGTNPFPHDGQQFQGTYWIKSNATDATTRPWILIATAIGFIMYVNAYNDTAAQTQQGQYFSFGDLVSDVGVVVDAYATLIVGNGDPNYYTSAWTNASGTASAPGHYMARSWTQLGSSIPVGRNPDIPKYGASAGVYPHPTDGNMYVSPIIICEPASGNVFTVRGILPGSWYPDFRSTNLVDNVQYVPSAGPLAGKKFEVHTVYPNPFFLEVSNTF